MGLYGILGLFMGYFTYDLIHRLEDIGKQSYKLQITVLSGLLYAGLYNLYGWDFKVVIGMMLVSTLLLILLIDWKTQIIPDQLNGLLLALALIKLVLSFSLVQSISVVVGALLGGGIMLLAAILTKGAIGGGDIKLLFALGLFFGGLDVFSILLLSFILAALLSLLLMVFKKKGMKDFIPLGPAIVIASLIQLYFGNLLF